MGDARRIRNQILSNFELATQPSIPEEESRRLLHVVIVGGGPTGVEFGAEIYDFVEQVILSQQARDINTTSPQHRCNIMTLHL